MLYISQYFSHEHGHHTGTFDVVGKTVVNTELGVGVNFSTVELDVKDGEILLELKRMDIQEIIAGVEENVC